MTSERLGEMFEGSCVRRPGSEDPIGASGILAPLDGFDKVQESTCLEFSCMLLLTDRINKIELSLPIPGLL